MFEKATRSAPFGNDACGGAAAEASSRGKVPFRHWGPMPFALSSNRRRLGLHLADVPILTIALGRAGRDRTFFTSASRWAADAGVSERGLAKSLSRLKGKFLRVVEEGRRGRATVYSVEPLDRLVAELEQAAFSNERRAMHGVQGTEFGEQRASNEVHCVPERDARCSPQQTQEKNREEQTPRGGELTHVDTTEDGDEATAAPSPPAGAGGIPVPSDTQEVAAPAAETRLEKFHQLYRQLLEQLRGVEHPVVGAPDTKVLRAVMDGRPDEVVASLIERFVADDDPFLRGRGWLLRLLELRVNVYLAKGSNADGHGRKSYDNSVWDGQASGEMPLD
jgi:hypothetical protein